MLVWRAAAIAHSSSGRNVVSQVAKARVDAEHRGVGAGHRAHDVVDTRGIADEGRHVIRQLRAFRIAHERDDVMLCGARRIDDVASEPTTCTEHGDPHALRSSAISGKRSH